MAGCFIDSELVQTLHSALTLGFDQLLQNYDRKQSSEAVPDSLADETVNFSKRLLVRLNTGLNTNAQKRLFALQLL